MAVLFLLIMIGMFTGFPAQLLDWYDTRHHRPLRGKEFEPGEGHQEGPFR